MKFDKINERDCELPTTTTSTSTTTTTAAPTTTTSPTTTGAPTTTAATTSTPEPTGLITLSITRATGVSSTAGCDPSTWFGVHVYDDTANYGTQSFESVKTESLILYWNTTARAAAGQPCFLLSTTLGDELTDSQILAQWPNFSVTLNADGTHSFATS